MTSRYGSALDDLGQRVSHRAGYFKRVQVVASLSKAFHQGGGVVKR
jgi:hypothetical protein